MGVHVVQAGRLVGNKTNMRWKGWLSLLRWRENFESAFAYIVEHHDGHPDRHRHECWGMGDAWPNAAPPRLL